MGSRGGELQDAAQDGQRQRSGHFSVGADHLHDLVRKDDSELLEDDSQEKAHDQRVRQDLFDELRRLRTAGAAEGLEQYHAAHIVERHEYQHQRRRQTHGIVPQKGPGQRDREEQDIAAVEGLHQAGALLVVLLEVQHREDGQDEDHRHGAAGVHKKPAAEPDIPFHVVDVHEGHEGEEGFEAEAVQLSEEGPVHKAHLHHGGADAHIQDKWQDCVQCDDKAGKHDVLLYLFRPGNAKLRPGAARAEFLLFII